MTQKAIAILYDGTKVTGELTTDHAASSYGQPVFVDESGAVFDIWQIVDFVPVEENEDGLLPNTQ